MAKNFNKYLPFIIMGNILFLHLTGYLVERMLFGSVSAAVWLGVAAVDMFFGFKCGGLVHELYQSDPLTGFQRDKGEVYRAIDETMAESTKPRVSVIKLDIDQFEAIRKEYGHIAADLVLAEIMDVLRVVVPPKGVVVQWGWTELMVVLSGVSALQARTLAEDMRNAMGAKAFNANGQEVKVSASFGVVTTDGRFEAGNILLLVEEALATARRQGDPIISFAVNHI